MNGEGVCKIIITTIFNVYISKHRVNGVNDSYILLNVMIKNQQIKGKFKLVLPFYKLRRRDKLLFKLLLQFTLYVVSHFAKFLNALSCSPIMLVQVLQI